MGLSKNKKQRHEHFEKVDVEIYWSKRRGSSPGVVQGFTSFAGRIFRLFYHQEQKVLGIYPCDANGSPIGLYLCGEHVGNIDLVLSKLVDRLDRQSLKDFLEWSINLYEDTGVIPHRKRKQQVHLGSLIEILLSEFKGIYGEDNAAKATAAVIGSIISRSVAQG
jgi:hypothetical protein